MAHTELVVTKSLLQTSCRILILCFCGFVIGMLFVNENQKMLGSKYIACGLWKQKHLVTSVVFDPQKHIVKDTTLPEEKFLFVGIMTARKFLNTRASASNKTWVPRVPGKVVYFMEHGDKYEGDLNVVQLDGVEENDYPPQKKSFAMIYYISKHYAQDYEWIVRADDDLYINVEELVPYLKSIDSSKFLYIGQPGSGKGAEKGKLGLSGPYCMGGPGIAMSNQLVTAIAPYLQDCINSTFTQHEDTELGRCIKQKLHIVCTSAAEMRSKFYQNYHDAWDPFSSFKKGLVRNEENALTLHPIKISSYTFQVDIFLTNRTIEKLKFKEKVLISDMKMTDHLTQNKITDKLSVTNIINDSRKWTHSTQLGTPDTHLPDTHQKSFFEKDTSMSDHCHIWDLIKHAFYSVFFESGKISLANTAKGRHLLQLATINQIRTSSWFSETEQNGSHLEFLVWTYQCLSTERGAHEIAFVRSKFENKNEIAPVYVRRDLPQHLVEFKESYRETLDIDNTIHVLLMIYKKSSSYINFLEQHEKAVKGYHGKVILRVVVFLDKDGDYKIVTAVTSIMLKYKAHLDVKLIYTNETFKRGNGMMLAVDDLDKTSLLLLMDVDMEYTTEFLQRVHKNTVLDYMAYFPVMFSLYSPDVICYKKENCEPDWDSRQNEVGLWRAYGFGIASIYKKNLISAGGFRTDIEGWGLEDVDLYEKVISAGINILRSVDNSIIHRYHSRECSISLSKTQMSACIGSKESSYGSFNQLYQMYQDMSTNEITSTN